MFSYPHLPALPTFLTPSQLISPLKSLLSPPQPIDYTQLQSTQSTGAKTDSKATKTHTGPLADLPLETCPICHLRHISSPLNLKTSSGEISLPRLPELGSFSGDVIVEKVEEVREETRIYVSARGDCWGGCVYCYYCLAGELAALAEQDAKHGGKAQAKVGGDDTLRKWDCLRCGGAVSRVWRVGAES